MARCAFFAYILAEVGLEHSKGDEEPVAREVTCKACKFDVEAWPALGRYKAVLERALPSKLQLAIWRTSSTDDETSKGIESLLAMSADDS